MKNTIFTAFLLITVFLIISCSGPKQDYSSAKNIKIKWELISNFIDVKDAFDTRFVFENHADFALTKNWKLFFNIAPRPIIAPPSPQKASVEHINGDWYQLVPSADFSLPQHESIEIIYRGTEGVIKETDAPLGAYFVFYNDDGSEAQIVEVDCEILPFTRAEQLNKNDEDKEPVPTAEYRYHNNAGLETLPKEKLLKIVPTPFHLKTIGGSTTVDEKWSIFHEDGLENEASYLAEKLQTITGVQFKTSTDLTGGN